MNEQLEERQEMFCQYFVRTLDDIGSVIKAGYGEKSARTQAYRLLKDKKVKRRIKELQKEPELIDYLNLNKLINKHVRIAFADIGDYVKWGTKNVNGIKRNYVELIDSNNVNTELVDEVSQGKDGVKIKLKDDKESLNFLIKVLTYKSNAIKFDGIDDIKSYVENLINNNISENKLSVLDKLIKIMELKQNINNENNAEDRTKAINDYLEATRPNKEFLDSVFDDEKEE